jgi:hypothetical protein
MGSWEDKWVGSRKMEGVQLSGGTGAATVVVKEM